VAYRVRVAKSSDARHSRDLLKLWLKIEEARHDWWGSRRATFGLFRIEPNVRTPWGHTHSEQEEIYVLVKGSARFAVGEEVVEADEWDAIRVPPGEWRGIEAGPDGAEVLAFGAPFTDNKDAEMKPGWWPES
jgi:quercetin dioxygenase-like cupin family protein